jgi:hypothetical protein
MIFIAYFSPVSWHFLALKLKKFSSMLSSEPASVFDLPLDDRQNFIQKNIILTYVCMYV